MTNFDVPVYSPILPTERTPEAANEGYRRMFTMIGGLPKFQLGTRDSYPALPWLLSELEGTEWVNIHSKSRSIGVVRLSYYGYPMLAHADGRPLGISLSSGTPVCIEHWIRYDILTVAEKALWEPPFLEAKQIRLDHKTVITQHSLFE